MILGTKNDRQSRIDSIDCYSTGCSGLEKVTHRQQSWVCLGRQSKIRRIMFNGFFILSFCIVPHLHVLAYDGITCSNGIYENYNRWGPLPGNEAEWVAPKWKRPIQYAVKDLTGGTSSASALENQVENEIPKFSKASGLKMRSYPAAANALIMISNDINATDLETSSLLRSAFIAAGSGSDVE